MWTLLIVLTFSFCGVLPWHKSFRWADDKKYQMDKFFDRIVAIILNKPDKSSYLKDHTCVTQGVLINNSTVLTSFNPFREFIKDKAKGKEFLIAVLHKRKMTNQSKVSYVHKNYTIQCARQIIPVLDDNNIWHFKKDQRSPLHDLMIIRLNESVRFLKYPNPGFNQYSLIGHTTLTTGPMMTVLAGRNDVMGRAITMASIGYVDRAHIRKSYQMRLHTFIEDDNVEANCDRWIPRSWGAFICIHNVENFRGVGSGAMLFYKKKLYGVGSFLLEKGKKSILVFTDVRVYSHLIRRTCTHEDQQMELSTSSTTTTSEQPN